MSRLVIKFPTRNRPEKFKLAFNRYLTFLSGRHDVQFIITMDEDDSTMNNNEIIEWLSTRSKNANIKWFYGTCKTNNACVNWYSSDYGPSRYLWSYTSGESRRYNSSNCFTA